MCSCYFLLQIAIGIQEAPDEISQHPRLSICWVWQIQINNLLMRRACLSRWSGYETVEFGLILNVSRWWECSRILDELDMIQLILNVTLWFDGSCCAELQSVYRGRGGRVWKVQALSSLLWSHAADQNIVSTRNIFRARSISVQWNRCRVQTSWTDTTDQNIVFKAINTCEFTLGLKKGEFIFCNTWIRGLLQMICATRMAIF